MDEEQVNKLLEENILLRKEVQVSRESANVTAQLVIKQFEGQESYIERIQVANAIQKAVLDAASRISIIATDSAGIIRLFNKGAEQMLGYTAEEVIGIHTPEIFHLEKELAARSNQLSQELNRPVQGIQIFFEYAQQENNRESEWIYVAKDGKRFPVSLSVTSMYNHDNEVTGILCASMDISQRKQAEREIINAKNAAEAANRTKSTFLANMSHELRTPLNAIIGYSEMLQEDLRDMELNEFVDDLEKINSAGKHLLALINDVLDLSKVEAGKLEFHVETFEVSSLINDIEDTVQPLVEKNNNVLEVECGDNTGSMNSDLVRTRQILFNLLSNACKFTEKGTITLKTERQSINGLEWIVFCVADTGIGMTPEQLEKVFDAFAQADSSTTKKYGGTGLGLAISKRFCEMMGGTIHVESTVGKGTTFMVFLPPDIEGEPAVKTIPEPITARQDIELVPGRNTILIIDDDPMVHDLMRRYLSPKGFNLFFAANGEDGLHLAHEINPQIITLDVLMPGMDGWSCLKHLKSDPELAHIPVIMVSIVDDQGMGFTLGAADYLIKPVNRQRLLEVINKYKRTDYGLALVIEDDKDTCELFMKMLEKEGWETMGAENGRVALDYMDQVRPDIILLDLMMPVMDGFEFMEIIKNNIDLHSIPIIVITAKDLTEEDYLQLSGHVNSIISKHAYHREQLLQEIFKQIARHYQQEKSEGGIGNEKKDSPGGR